MSSSFNPYRREYDIRALKVIEKEDDIYAKFDKLPVFLGNKKVATDIFKIDGKEPVPKSFNDGLYFRVSEKKDNYQFSIDLDRRLDIMQHNLGAHIFMSFLEKTTEHRVLNYKIDRGIDLEISGSDISFSELEELEKLCNLSIAANISVQKNPKIFIEGIGNLDYEGPILNRTGEIALLKVVEVKKSENIYLKILCGLRAFKDYSEKSKLLKNISYYLNVGEEEVFSYIKSAKKPKTSEEDHEHPTSEKAVAEEIENPNSKLEKRVEFFKSQAVEIEGIRYIRQIFEGEDIESLKEITNYITKEKDYVEIYGLSHDYDAKVIISCSKNLKIDIKKMTDEIAKKFGFKTTGNLYYAECECKKELLGDLLELFFKEIKNMLKKI